jgi:CheY-like chemotaxis protein
MPVMDGIECLTEIKKNPKNKRYTSSSPVGFNSQTELVKKLGAKVFLKKTSDGNTLREQLEQLLHSDAADDNHMVS